MGNNQAQEERAEVERKIAEGARMRAEVELYRMRREKQMLEDDKRRVDDWFIRIIRHHIQQGRLRWELRTQWC
ncbi:hypothetical protein AAFF_G00344080 [Aldrovandia affinis]|uniref:Uncharacterized protein n=1 Tax=Aldrovandia affinis TaxID=143900 RepID=A0AAD7SKM8_9TELE|nr:hypothetical protein AAFF_G00344080 [Aldrovandia affinis]